VGLGAGDHWSEFTRFGYPLDRPIGRFEEALRIIVPLLRDGHVDFAGEFHTARDVELVPRGRESGPPILIGALGSGPRMARLVAEYADLWNGWYTFDDTDPYPDLVAALDRMDAACSSRGRDPRSLGRTAGLSVAFEGFDAEGGSISGSDEEIAVALRRWADAGVEHLQVVTSPPGPAGVERLARVLELVDAG
jgi:alkanesulfonate monooxygenase SsuD/methylene tetrahydromethanopterin reductase-like flavin-dependent oxidoreductase (luciferase family)